MKKPLLALCILSASAGLCRADSEPTIKTAVKAMSAALVELLKK